MQPKLVPTSIIVQAAIFASPKTIKKADGTYVDIPPFRLMDTNIKTVEGSRNRTKMVFWFENTKELKEVALAFSNGELLVDPNSFHQKYIDFRNMTFNKGFAGEN